MSKLPGGLRYSIPNFHMFFNGKQFRIIKMGLFHNDFFRYSDFADFISFSRFVKDSQLNRDAIRVIHIEIARAIAGVLDCRRV